MSRWRAAVGWAWASIVLPASVIVSGNAIANECGAALAQAGRQQVVGSGYTVAFVPSQWPIPVGQHFSLAVQVCAEPGKRAPSELRVDADMPAHRHGMNYRVTVQETGEGRYHAEGLMFHMPGRWRIRLELGRGAQAVRLEREVQVP